MDKNFFEKNGVISDRINSVKASPTMNVAVKANAMRNKGIDVINMSVGELDFNTPKCVCDAAVEAIDKGKTTYTSSFGIEPLRRLISEYVNSYAHTNFSFENICVNSGAKQSLFNIFFSIINSGDEVIIPKPFWVSFPDMVLLTGGVPVFCDYKEDDYTIDLKSLENSITEKTKAIILNFPSNPSGAAYDKFQLRKLADVLIKYPNIAIISDDTYSAFVYDFPFIHLLEIEPLLASRTIIVNSFSKSFAMTGWRIGYVAAEKTLIDKISIIQSQSTSCPCSISQYAALEALKSGQNMSKEFKKSLKLRRDKAFEILSSINGVNLVKPAGAFYFFLSCEKIIRKNAKIVDDNMLSELLLEEYKVASVAGSAFGADNHIRLSYALGEDDLLEGCKRIKRAFESF